MPTAFLWFPAVAVAAHLIEEFVWPGGFAEWYRHYPPGETVMVSDRLLVIVNVVFGILALLPPILGSTPRGLAFWLVVAAVAAVNAAFHLIAVARTRAYSPGVVTGFALYLPLAFVGGSWLIRERLAGGGVIVQAILIAVAYQMWSSWNHRKHARATGSPAIR